MTAPHGRDLADRFLANEADIPEGNNPGGALVAQVKDHPLLHVWIKRRERGEGAIRDAAADEIVACRCDQPRAPALAQPEKADTALVTIGPGLQVRQRCPEIDDLEVG